jgi:Tfp pilus assembly protein PilX
MNRHHHQRSREQGVALIVALVVLLILSTLTASLIFSSRTEVWSTSNYRLMMQARYAAESGAQNAINWINTTNPMPPVALLDLSKSPVQHNGRPVVLSAMSGVASNYPTGAVQTAFSNTLIDQAVGAGVNATSGSYATLMSMKPIGASYLQIWQVTAQGRIAGVKAASVQIVETIEKNTSALQNFAVYAVSPACNALSFDGNITTDSWNSGAGTYGATKQASGGNIGTNGSMHGDSGDNIQGSLTTPQNPTTGSCPGAALSGIGAGAIKGGIVRGAVLSFPPPSMPAQPLGNATTNNSYPDGTFTLSPGTYGNITLHKTTIHVSAGVYNMNSFSTTDAASIIFDSTPVVFNVWGTNPSGGSSVGYNFFKTGGPLAMSGSTVPSAFTINSLSQGTFSLNDAWALYSTINIPNSNVAFTNSGDLYGSLIAYTVTPTSNTKFHFDTASTTSGVVGNYHVTSFNWSRF